MSEHEHDTQPLASGQAAGHARAEVGSRRLDIRSLDEHHLEELVASLGLPRFRARQIYDWVWKRGVTSFDEMTNLPKALREQLAQVATLGGATEAARQVSSDGSRKYLVEFDDGTAVECVGMPTADRLAACVSTQAGCPMGCAFCATGRSGLTRSLTADEIYDQVMHIRNDFGRRVTSVVLMGQGEPFLNYDNSLAAMRMLNSPEGANIGARHITVSTSGIIPMIARFAHEKEQFTLAVSLHSAVQRTRDALMPGVKQYSLLRLYDVMGTYVDLTGRRPTYEYALIAGVNDTDNELISLRDFLAGTLAHVNLIQLNEVPGSPFHPSSPARANDFVRVLTGVGVECTIRNSRGQDIDAACGQLRQRMRH